MKPGMIRTGRKIRCRRFTQEIEGRKWGKKKRHDGEKTIKCETDPERQVVVSLSNSLQVPLGFVFSSREYDSSSHIQ